MFTILGFLMLEATLFPRKLTSYFRFFTFVLHFMLDPGPNPNPVPLRQKVAVPAVPAVSQHFVGGFPADEN
jgi:hypothetical protein